MNDRVDDEALLARFRDWLKEARARASAPEVLPRGLDSGLAAPAREFGMFDLVEEFTALRHELKLQTKSGRSLIEQSESTVSALRRAIDQLRAVDAKETQAAWTAGKALADA